MMLLRVEVSPSRPASVNVAGMRTAYPSPYHHGVDQRRHSLGWESRGRSGQGLPSLEQAGQGQLLDRRQ